MKMDVILFMTFSHMIIMIREVDTLSERGAHILIKKSYIIKAIDQWFLTFFSSRQNLVAHLCLGKFLKQLKKSLFCKVEPKYLHFTPNVIEN